MTKTIPKPEIARNPAEITEVTSVADVEADLEMATSLDGIDSFKPVGTDQINPAEMTEEQVLKVCPYLAKLALSNPELAKSMAAEHLEDSKKLAKTHEETEANFSFNNPDTEKADEDSFWDSLEAEFSNPGDSVTDTHEDKKIEVPEPKDETAAKTPTIPANLQPEEQPTELNTPPELIVAKTLPPEESGEVEFVAASQAELHKKQSEEVIITQQTYTEKPGEPESRPPETSEVKVKADEAPISKKLENTDNKIQIIAPEEKSRSTIIKKRLVEEENTIEEHQEVAALSASEEVLEEEFIIVETRPDEEITNTIRNAEEEEIDEAIYSVALETEMTEELGLPTIENPFAAEIAFENQEINEDPAEFMLDKLELSEEIHNQIHPLFAEQDLYKQQETIDESLVIETYEELVQAEEIFHTRKSGGEASDEISLLETPSFEMTTEGEDELPATIGSSREIKVEEADEQILTAEDENDIVPLEVIIDKLFIDSLNPEYTTANVNETKVLQPELTDTDKTAETDASYISLNHEMTKRLLLFIRSLGYKEPKQELINFVSKHGFEPLARIFAYMDSVSEFSKHEAFSRLRIFTKTVKKKNKLLLKALFYVAFNSSSEERLVAA